MTYDTNRDSSVSSSKPAMRASQTAKNAARRLRSSLADRDMAISTGQSLEILSELCGRKDWNTLSAEISGKTAVTSTSAPLDPESVMRSVLALDSGDSRKIIRRIERFVLPDGYFSQADGMWQHRLHAILRGLIPVLVLRGEVTGEPITTRHLFEAMSCTNRQYCYTYGDAGWPMSLSGIIAWIYDREISGDAIDEFKAVMGSVPGFRSPDHNSKGSQDAKFVEQYNFTTIHFRNLLGEFIDEMS